MLTKTDNFILYNNLYVCEGKMEKFDFKKAYKNLYNPKPQFNIIKVCKFTYLSVAGQGNPNNCVEYKNAIEALYAIAYGLKFLSKTKYQKDYVIAPLEGLWWAHNMDDFINRNKDNWSWEMLINTPQWIDDNDLQEIITKAKNKKPNSALEKVKLKSIEEGECVQILHIGSYDDEGPILAKMHNEFIPQNGYKMCGLHHEIYISDPRKTPSDKLKTILRQPVLKQL
jgi:hypothetical protein